MSKEKDNAAAKAADKVVSGYSQLQSILNKGVGKVVDPIANSPVGKGIDKATYEGARTLGSILAVPFKVAGKVRDKIGDGDGDDDEEKDSRQSNSKGGQSKDPYVVWKNASGEFREKYFSKEDNSIYNKRFAQEQDKANIGEVDRTELFPANEKRSGPTGGISTDFYKRQDQVNEEIRTGRNEGSLMAPVGMDMEQDMPVDTYPNIPPEEMDEAMASQLPDPEMEDEYIDVVMDQALTDDEQMYLEGALQSDPKLSEIIDKVVITASEFTGEGEVSGPGTGVSDSIPARLSDGEFVFTKKATDQLGADNLQVMMDDAERAYDGGYQKKAIGGYMFDDPEQSETTLPNKIDEEIKKAMIRANKIPSLQ